MAKKSNNLEDDHNQLPSDEATKRKIDKHLSDINDTISEEDMKNINTSTGIENSSVGADETTHEKQETHEREAEGTEKRGNEKGIDQGDEEEPKKEMPSSWDILS